MANRHRWFIAYALLASLVACTVPNPNRRRDAGCVAESDAEFCARVGATCEDTTRDDNCGTARTVSCGACSGGQPCVENVCRAPVCSSFTFPVRTLVSALNDPAKQDIVAGVSTDGKTVLWYRGACDGSAFRMLIGDSNGIAYSITDLTDQPALAQFAFDEEGTVALTADGLSIIGMSDDHTSFLQAIRSGVGSTSFGQVTNVAFAALNVDVSKKIHFPVISSDGLAFYFRLEDGSDPSKTGIYETVRTSPSVPFPAATRLPALVQAYEAVTGISSDRLVLFVENNVYQVSVLTRKSLKDPFTNPNAPGPAPMVPGFRTRPLGDCQSLIGTVTTGGCAAQEIAIFTK